MLYREQLAKKLSLFFVSFASGTLLGAAFFELLPGSLETLDFEVASLWVIIGLLTLLMLEKSLKWYHRHDHEESDHRVLASSVMIGDSLHNFIDGITIALSFAISVEVGVATTLAVLFHEVPQEIGDFGVLLHAGYSKAKILTYNFITALATPVGAIAAFLLMPFFSEAIWYFLALAAGSFIYISVSDLIPEVRRKAKPGNFVHVFLIIAGVFTIWYLGILIPE